MGATRPVKGRTSYDGLAYSGPMDRDGITGVEITGKVTEGPIGVIGRRLELFMPVGDILRLADRMKEEFNL